MTPNQKNKLAMVGGFFGLLIAIAATVTMIWVQVRHPNLIVTNNTVMMPNDSLIAMRIKIAELTTHDSAMTRAAAQEREIILAIAPSFEKITDSLLSTMRKTQQITELNAVKLLAADAAREQKLTTFIGRINGEQEFSGTLEHALSLLSPTMIKIKHDTVYGTLPDKRNLWERIKNKKK